jgi:dihydrofolate reductase
VEGVRQLKASEGPALHVWGSGELVQTLIAAELVDEHRLWVFPLVLGEGKRLFEQGLPPFGLSLVATRSTPSGVVEGGRTQLGRSWAACLARIFVVKGLLAPCPPLRWGTVAG